MLVTHFVLKNWRNCRENWRNCRAVGVPLRENSFLLGPNASGKSNFLDVFRFLRVIRKPEGGSLQKAIKDRGGIPKLRCLHARKQTDVRKDFLLNLARKAPRDVKRDLLSERGAIACRGIGYHQMLCDYVNNLWNPTNARQRSESLSRVIRRLGDLSASMRTTP
jgi:hypothetical protein